MSLSDDELHQVVQHLAKINGVPTSEVVAEVMGEDPEDDEQEADPSNGEEPKKRGWEHWVAGSSAMMVMGLMVGCGVVSLCKLVSGPAVEGVPTP